MNPTKRANAAALPALQEAIDQGVYLQRDVDELCERLKQIRGTIKALMEEMQVERQLTAAGNEALLIAKQSYTWDAEKLAKMLDEEQLDHLVPRKPDGDSLRAFLDSAPPDLAAKLKGCKKNRNSTALELRVAPASEPGA